MKIIVTFILVLIITSAIAQVTWTKKQDFPDVSGRTNAVSFALNNELYVGTGSMTRTFYKYNPSNNTWSDSPPLPADSRSNATAFTINGKAYCGTGNLATGSVANDFYEYNPATNVWSQKTNVGNTGIEGAVSFTVNGRGYIALGTTNGDFFNPNYNTVTWEYNPVSDTWNNIATWPAGFGPGLTDANSFVLNNQPYVFGGNLVSPQDEFRYSSFGLVKFNLLNYQWEFVSSAPSNGSNDIVNAKSKAAALTTINNVYFIGGYFTCYSAGIWDCFTKTILKWNQTTNIWTMTPDEYPEGYFALGQGINLCEKQYIVTGDVRQYSDGGAATLTKSLYQLQLPNDNSINGSSLVCITGSTFNLNYVPSNSTITWQATPANLFAVSSGTGSSAMLTAANSNTSGSGTLTFSIASQCGGTPVQVSKTVWVGKPAIMYDQKQCYGEEAVYKYSSPSIPEVTYSWSINNPNLSLNTYGNICYVSGEPGGPSQSFVLTLKIQHGGCSTTKTRSGTYADCPGGGGHKLNVYPNPAASEFTVEYEENPQSPDSELDEPIQIELINSKLEKVFSIRTKNSTTTIPVNELPRGIYYLNFTNKEGVLQRQIKIER